MQGGLNGCKACLNVFIYGLLLIPINEQVELEATTNDLGTTLRAPTKEAGLAPACKDTCFGDLRLKIWEKISSGTKGKVCYCHLPDSYIFHQFRARISYLH